MDWSIQPLSKCTYRVQKLERKRQAVHFNWLRPCPTEIRINTDGQPTTPDDPTMEKQNQSNPQWSPVGTHLEEIDDDDDNDDEMAVYCTTIITPPSHQLMQLRHIPHNNDRDTGLRMIMNMRNTLNRGNSVTCNSNHICH